MVKYLTNNVLDLINKIKMDKAKLYLKTIFCCMACDGEITKEEIEMVKNVSSKNNIFSNFDVESLINQWIVALNENGAAFLKSFLNELSLEDLTSKEQMLIIDFALKTIEADNCIEYSEIKFFKKLRGRLSISDEDILQCYPDKEDFLLADVKISDDLNWDNNIQFTQISLNL